MTAETFSLETVRQSLAPHLKLYRWRAPRYQQTMLNQLRKLWRPQDRRVLDVGGGTGVIAQAIATLFPVDRVVSIDVESRFAPTLDIETVVQRGSDLPFADGEFDCVVMNNVLHHVPVAARSALLRECARVSGRGAIYIKDHLSASALDDARLVALDLMGNLPFEGMLSARYLRDAEWRELASRLGYSIEALESATYRTGPMALGFPNRLEIAMRWEPIGV